VSALGGPADFIDNMDRHLVAAPIIRDVFALGQGKVTAIDTREVGMAVVALGGGRTTPTDSIDHTVGFDRLAGLGATIDGTTPIARIHARDEASAADAEARLKSAYRLGDSAPAFPLIADVVSPV
jgi:thymidine phosphorylase